MKHNDWLIGVYAARGSVTLLLVLGQMAIATAQESPVVTGKLGVPDTDKPLVFQADETKVQFRVVTIAKDLSHPWSMAFLPDGRTMLVTERPGRLRVIRDGVLEPQPVGNLPKIEAVYLGGLSEVALHPNFASNRLVYLSYSKSGPGGVTLALMRGRLNEAATALSETKEIFVADAWESAGSPIAGRMVFGRDGTLYLSVGDRAVTDPASSPRGLRVQRLDNHMGKVLRLRDDGSVPPDNPFVGRADARPEIFTYGHRNTYGLAIHPDTGELWQTEIGPQGGDEVNVLLPGRNYGWPLVSMGLRYEGEYVSEQPWWRPGIEMPRFHWMPSFSPSGMAFYTGDRFPRWKGHLFVGGLHNGEGIYRLKFNDKGLATTRSPRHERLVSQLGERIRDVRQGPDGYLYFLTEGQTMLGTNLDGAVLRIEPLK
jgi:aldose sugar dehydrogenase